MSRIIFVPQYPTPMRYQEWWYDEMPFKLRQAGFDVEVLGDYWVKQFRNVESDPKMFSPINTAINFEAEQIKQYMNMNLYTDDILFLADLSFPGFFANVLYHKNPSRSYAFCHATSINTYDYFEDVSYSKFLVERAHAKVFEKIFVGSYYHRDKIEFPNCEVVYLPIPPLKTFRSKKKKYDIVSASRPTKQKVDMGLEMAVENKFNTKIIRKKFDTWEKYYKFLSQSKILLVTSHEDTFGYQLVDAALNDCIPIARKALAYPEILPSTYLYEDRDELFRRIESVLESYTDSPTSSKWAGPVPVPDILCYEEMEEFYDRIIETFKGE